MKCRVVPLLFAGLALMVLLPALAQGQPSHPFGVPEFTVAAGGGWLSGFFAQMSAWQTHFYRQLTGALRAWQQDGHAGWLLVGLSFAYGVFHALGPGHGKAVISSYVLANRQTVRNGALLAFVSAMVQAATAIALVSVAGLLLNVTGAVMNRATWWLEVGSYALVTALGAWLVAKRVAVPVARGLRRRIGPGEARIHGAHGHGHAHAQGHAHGHGHVKEHDAHDHAGHHHHDDHCGCGHAHIPDPAQVSGTLDWRRASAAVLSVGLRPCTGAVIVLVFAMSQQFYLAGIASALAMGVGTGLTVAVLACLALAAGGLATRLAGGRRRWAATVRAVIEGGAALAVLAFGILLLGGSLAA